MHHKPTALIEGWQAFYLHGRPHLLMGFVTDHPHLGGYRRHIRTSRVLYLSEDLSAAETLNTRYSLRHRVTDMAFEDRFPVRIEIADLVARCLVPGGDWQIVRCGRCLADVLPDYKLAILRMLALLDDEGL